MAAIVERIEKPTAIVPFLPPDFVSCLRATLPASCLLTDPEDTSTYESDGLFHLHEKPLAVALPENETQVAAVLRACRDFGIPIVPLSVQRIGPGARFKGRVSESDGSRRPDLFERATRDQPRHAACHV